MNRKPSIKALTLWAHLVLVPVEMCEKYRAHRWLWSTPSEQGGSTGGTKGGGGEEDKPRTRTIQHNTQNNTERQHHWCRCTLWTGRLRGRERNLLVLSFPGMEEWRDGGFLLGAVCEVLTTLVEQNINYSRENQLRSVRLSF